jgi:hypothetical protein
VTSALNVVTVGKNFILFNALRGKGNVFDRQTGKVVSSSGHNYACCRFTLSEPFVLGANMDMIDLSNNGKLVSTGPAIDSRECLGLSFRTVASFTCRKPAASSSRRHTAKSQKSCRLFGADPNLCSRIPTTTE